jgi:hydrogenase-4 component F
MILVLLVLLPALLGAVSFTMRSLRRKLVVLVAGAIVHALLTAAAWVWRPGPAFGLAIDSLGLTFLAIASALFLASALHSMAYLPRQIGDHGEATGRYVPSLFAFLAAMSLSAESTHLGLLWVAIEATTLASAPLVSFERTQGALEAMWKYLLLCSVGIALSLLGTFFVGIAFHAAAIDGGLSFGALVGAAKMADPTWVRAAFLLAVVGYGTKMGLAPLHTWLPDAHSEAPSPVSALLSGALLNCAFLGILRFFEIAAAAGLADFARQVLLVFGLISLAIAAGSILGQRDYKRLLAYSSVENVGILALGIGIGGGASYGALLHAVNHSLAKAMLFLLAGNVVLAYRTKRSADVRGVSRELPATGALLFAAMFAIGGLPPFGLFQSELTILVAAVASGRIAVAVVFVALAAVAFVGIVAVLLPMLQGSGREQPVGDGGESWLLVGPPLALGGALLVLGVYVPPALDALLRSAAAFLDG